MHQKPLASTLSFVGLDWYGAYNKNENVNPEGPSIGTERVLRGGSWHNPASRSRVSYRGHNSPDRRAGYRGFRIVCHDEEGAEPQGNDDNGNDDDDDED